MGSEYINNKDFEKLLEKFNENQDDEKLREEITLCFYLLSENIIKAFKFRLIDRDDALQEGVYTCLKQMHLFDKEKGKAFNWFTTIILNHYRQLYRYARNYNELKRRFIEDEYLDKNKLNFNNNDNNVYY